MTFANYKIPACYRNVTQKPTFGLSSSNLFKCFGIHFNICLSIYPKINLKRRGLLAFLFNSKNNHQHFSSFTSLRFISLSLFYLILILFWVRFTSGSFFLVSFLSSKICLDFFFFLFLLFLFFFFSFAVNYSLEEKKKHKQTN